VGGELNAAIEEARRRWPRLEVDRAAFRRRLEAGGARALAHAADLYLAFACLSGNPEATRELARLIEGEVSRAVRRLGRDAAFTQDVQQQLLVKLLTPDKRERPKIEAYVGRGPLAAWLRAAAVRTALNEIETEKPNATIDRSLAAPSRSVHDAELAVLRRKHGNALKAAVEAALRAMSPEERSVLRFYFVDGLTVDRIARIRGSHKSTVSRLIARVREQLLEHVQETLVTEKNANPSEVSSVARAVMSHIDVSIERALRSSASG
jgi:RNA polymerase sigma-70 factor (ECF subfamily)